MKLSCPLGSVCLFSHENRESLLMWCVSSPKLHCAPLKVVQLLVATPPPAARGPCHVNLNAGHRLQLHQVLPSTA